MTETAVDIRRRLHKAAWRKAGAVVAMWALVSGVVVLVLFAVNLGETLAETWGGVGDALRGRATGVASFAATLGLVGMILSLNLALAVKPGTTPDGLSVDHYAANIWRQNLNLIAGALSVVALLVASLCWFSTNLRDEVGAAVGASLIALISVWLAATIAVAEENAAERVMRKAERDQQLGTIRQRLGDLPHGPSEPNPFYQWEAAFLSMLVLFSSAGLVPMPLMLEVAMIAVLMICVTGVALIFARVRWTSSRSRQSKGAVAAALRGGYLLAMGVVATVAAMQSANWPQRAWVFGLVFGTMTIGPIMVWFAVWQSRQSTGLLGKLLRPFWSIVRYELTTRERQLSMRKFPSTRARVRPMRPSVRRASIVRRPLR